MRLFAIRDFRHLFSAQIIALFGTGLATVALGLLAYELAGASAGAVLATALTIKMVMYVLIAPLAAAYADRLPRRMFLTLLDVVRAMVVLALPFVTEIWQIYVLIGVLQAASAAFTPTFQAVIPDIVPEESDYTRALSASQVAYTMESLLSPVLAAVALTFMTFNWLFVGTSVGFVLSAILVLSTRIPNAAPSGQAGAWNRVTSGMKVFFSTPRLRGVMALNLVVAAAGSIVVVNTVNYVRDQLGGTQADVAWMLAASGGGTLLVALFLPRVLDRRAGRHDDRCRRAACRRVGCRSDDRRPGDLLDDHGTHLGRHRRRHGLDRHAHRTGDSRLGSQARTPCSLRSTVLTVPPGLARNLPDCRMGRHSVRIHSRMVDPCGSRHHRRHRGADALAPREGNEGHRRRH